MLRRIFVRERGVVRVENTLFALAGIFRDIGVSFAQRGRQLEALQAYWVADSLLDRAYERI